ncbi:MAG: hypothetical protein M1820_010351 [Bogoriella megaspora]|nr:MAG: hypothetical protein M1820_010351 [Bogoriella megaspora]
MSETLPLGLAPDSIPEIKTGKALKATEQGMYLGYYELWLIVHQPSTFPQNYSYLSITMSAADLFSSVVVAWGMPVEFIDLTASLKAYVQLLPITTTLKLCAKRGEGPNVYINRLSPEIVSMIEAFLTGPLYAEIQASLLLSYRCVMGTCKVTDHFDEDDHEIEEFIAEMEVDTSEEELFPSEEGTFNEASCSNCDFEQHKYCKFHMDSFIDDRMDGLVDQHLYENAIWQGEVVRIWKEEGLPGKCLKDALLDYFGLEVLICHQHLTEPEKCLLEVKQSRWHGDDNRVTTCTLTLPGYKSSRGMEVDDDFYDEDRPFAVSTSGFLDPNMLVLSDDKAQKFRSAIRILGLKPFSHPTQLPQDARIGMNRSTLHVPWRDGPEPQKMRKAAYEQHQKAMAKKQWPQLLVSAAADLNPLL